MKDDRWTKYNKIAEAINALKIVRDEEMSPIDGSLVNRRAMESIISTLTFYELAYEPFEL